MTGMLCRLRACLHGQETSGQRRLLQGLGLAGTALAFRSCTWSVAKPTRCDDAVAQRRGFKRSPLPKERIVELATLINAAVDIPDMDTDEAHEIVENTVERIISEMETFLPQSYWNRIMTTKTVPEASRQLLRDRLVDHFQKTLHFPYLTARDQDLIVRATVAIVADAMGDTKLDDILTRQDTSISLVRIFIQEAMGIDKVDKLPQDVADMVNLPFPVPDRWLKWGIRKGLGVLVSILNDAVDDSLAQCFGPAPSYDIATTEAFQAALRANVVERVHQKFALFFIPSFVEQLFIKQIVETYFELCVTKPRIDVAVDALLLPSSDDSGHDFNMQETLAADTP
ncbi:hypothetical protein Ae201684P_018657 [Aphanomyces euteiches]|nr:hypothetical protein Ae201684P_018657 [Aphanomyces euteiches]